MHLRPKAPRASRIEPLEERVLFSGFSAAINFQPANVPVPSGYLADTGAVFGDRGNGLTYGWNGNRPAATRNQKAGPARAGPDARYDTFALLTPRGRASEWQIAVPNGDYQIDLVVGGPLVFPAHYRVEVNGAIVLDGVARGRAPWVQASGQITVTDGMITLTAPRGTTDRLDYVNITQTVSPPPTIPPSPPSPPSPPPAWTQSLVWNTEASAPVPLAEAMSVGVDGKLFVVGGYNVDSPNYLATTDAEAYDVAANSWSSIAPLPEPLTHSGIATDGTYIYVAGGYVTDLGTGVQTFGTTDVWRYDIASNTWSSFVSLPAARGAGAMVIVNDELHFFGGVDPSRTGQTDQWVLNLADSNPQWTATTSMPQTRNHMAGEVVNGMIYAIGGQPSDDDSDPSDNAWVFDPTTQVWTAIANLPTALSHMATGVIAGRIVVSGGTQTDDLPLNNVYSYDPTTNTWSTQTSLPSPRLAPTGGVVGDELIVTTGYQYNNGIAGFSTDTWEATIG